MGPANARPFIGQPSALLGRGCLQGFESQGIKLVGDTQHPRAIPRGRRRSRRTEHNHKVGCGKCQVDVTRLVGTGGNELCPKSRFVKIRSQRCVIHRGGFPDEGGDVQDVVFAG